MILLERTGELAVFGGEPLFQTVRTTGQLANRDPEAFFARMTGAFDRRRLTNQGPLVAELEQQLRELHRTKHAVTFANACFALLLAARFLARPGARKVLMPAFTFRGLPHLLRWAGLEPEYCDVDPIYHTLAPDAVARSIGPDVALVLAVDNVSALCDIDALEAVTRAAQVPLLLDSVYGIGGHYAGDPVGSRGDAAVFSLHATKLINGFEGGYLTTNDDALATALQKDRNFGFDADGIAHGWSLNAKLNEIHAALALSNLPHLDRIIADNHTRFAAYQQALSGIPWLGFADYSRSPGNYGLCLLRVDATAPYTRNELIRILRNENALVRPYYSPPLHRTVGPDQGHFALPVTDNLAGVFIQMPVGDQVSVDDIHRLGDFFRQLHREQSVIVPRLRSLVCE
jgi:dTDP-4-amino-4,6-dideoxyglucose